MNLVRVMRATEDDELHNIHIGDIGTVIDHDVTDDTVLVKFTNRTEWWFYLNQITEVE